MYFEYFIYHIVLKISLLEIKQILRSTYQEKESTVFKIIYFLFLQILKYTISYLLCFKVYFYWKYEMYEYIFMNEAVWD